MEIIMLKLYNTFHLAVENVKLTQRYPSLRPTFWIAFFIFLLFLQLLFLFYQESYISLNIFSKSLQHHFIINIFSKKHCHGKVCISQSILMPAEIATYSIFKLHIHCFCSPIHSVVKPMTREVTDLDLYRKATCCCWLMSHALDSEIKSKSVNSKQSGLWTLTFT